MARRTRHDWLLRAGLLLVLFVAWYFFSATLPVPWPTTRPGPPDVSPTATPPQTETIKIASFNIQTFGQSKVSRDDTMEFLARIARRYDIVAIQEVRSKKQDVLPRFIERINADGSQYAFVLGPRLGRSISKEQYAFVYDTQDVRLLPGSVYTVPDPDDLLHREPLVASFQARGPPADVAFTFTLINIHTDPDEVPEELAALAESYRFVQSWNPQEDDVLLLGDLNASRSELGPLGEIPLLETVLLDATTNTRRTKQYDHLFYHRSSTLEFTGQAGVLDLEATFGIDRQTALKISDHLPVWAEFQVFESAAPLTLADALSGQRE